MSPLQSLLDRYRAASATHREQGTYFEELTVAYLKNEPAYRELYRDVMPYAVWAEWHGLDKRDAGIDVVAETVSGGVHAIQCKLYASDYRVQKADIDSFFTASGKKPFTHRLIFSTTNLWTDHAEEALRDQHTSVTKIDLAALENSAIDWSRFAPGKPVAVKKQRSLRPDQQDALNKGAPRARRRCIRPSRGAGGPRPGARGRRWTHPGGRVISRLLLDTNVLVRLCHPTAHADIQEWFKSLLLRGKDAPELLVSVISDYEIRKTFLRRGARGSLTRLDDLARSVTYVPVNVAITRRASELAASLNMPDLAGISDADFLIAAQAMVLSAVLVSSDRALQAIPGLPVKDWKDVVLT